MFFQNNAPQDGTEVLEEETFELVSFLIADFMTVTGDLSIFGRISEKFIGLEVTYDFLLWVLALMAIWLIFYHVRVPVPEQRNPIKGFISLVKAVFLYITAFGGLAGFMYKPVMIVMMVFTG